MSDSFSTVMVDAIPGLVSWVDSDLRYLAVNRELANLLGVDPAEIVGKPVGFRDGAKVNPFESELRAFFASPKEKWHFEFSVQSEKGERFFGVWGQKYENGTHAVLIGIDVTERKTLELEAEVARGNQFQQAKLVSMGEMAASIGHEVNNPLSIITAHASKLKELASRALAAAGGKSEFSSQVTTSAEKVLKTAQRISKTVNGLKNFSRDGRYDPIEKVKLQAVIDDAVELCRGRASRASVELRLPTLTEELWVNCRPVQLTQVLVNLVSNAIDAGEGKDGAWVRVEALRSDGFVVVRVVDSGKGIPAEVQKKLMTPFFTTKPRGKGTGLGLSISHNIMASMGGSLKIDSVAQNTTFVMTLPSENPGAQAA